MALIEIEKWRGFGKIVRYIGNLIRHKSGDVNNVGADGLSSEQREEENRGQGDLKARLGKADKCFNQIFFKLFLSIF